MNAKGKRGRTLGFSLSLLSDFSLRFDGRVVDVAPTPQRLAAFLAIHGGQALRRAYVSGILWPEAPQARANASLRTAIWRAPVRHGEALVGASGTHVWLHPDLHIDLRRCAERGRRVLQAQRLDDDQVDARLDVGQFTEDLLLGWYDDWVVLERERFRQLRLHVLEHYAELLLCAGRTHQALEVGLILVASDPLRESAQRLLVRAHLSEGNVVEALRQYRSYTDLLARELGVRPSKAMEELVHGAVSRGRHRSG